jgi:subtilisin family serine protease
VPIVSVGALNPDLDSTALFSNTGPWVRVYEAGAAVMSTMPPFQGGLMPLARTRAYGRVRESIDPDDFTRWLGEEDERGRKKHSGGFALWSGTSFAAPRVAGKLAARLVGALPEEGDADSKDAAVSRGWSAVTAVTGITQ